MKRTALCASLILAVTLLTGATIRIPPARVGPIRVRSTGTGTGTGVETAPRDGLDVEFLMANYDPAAGPPGVGSRQVWLDTGPNGWNASDSSGYAGVVHPDGISFSGATGTTNVRTYQYAKPSTVGTIVTAVMRGKFADYGASNYAFDGLWNPGRMGFGVYSGGLIYYKTYETGASTIAGWNDSNEHVFIWECIFGVSNRVFIDGVNQNVTGTPGSAGFTGLMIGCAAAGNYQIGPNSRIKSLRLYNRVLTPAEIAATYW